MRPGVSRFAQASLCGDGTGSGVTALALSSLAATVSGSGVTALALNISSCRVHACVRTVHGSAGPIAVRTTIVVSGSIVELFY